ncbi:hypothetical protein SNEBB_005148 [Seison nebaliae]|nr:hypothetical protein SNEBB_005148 [Seison nebaliae]
MRTKFDRLCRDTNRLVDNDPSRSYNNRNKKKKIPSRKEKRKQVRLNKKKKKQSSYHQFGNKANSSQTSDHDSIIESDQEMDEKKFNDIQSQIKLEKKVKEKKKEIYEVTAEDLQIAHYSKLLKQKRRKKNSKLNIGDLDDVSEAENIDNFIDELFDQSYSKNSKKKDDELIEGDSDNNDDDNDDDDDDNDNDDDDNNDNDGDDGDNDDDDNNNDNDDGEKNNNDNDGEKNKINEDIYGRELDDEGNVIKKEKNENLSELNEIKIDENHQKYFFSICNKLTNENCMKLSDNLKNYLIKKNVNRIEIRIIIDKYIQRTLFNESLKKVYSLTLLLPFMTTLTYLHYQKEVDFQRIIPNLMEKYLKNFHHQIEEINMNRIHCQNILNFFHIIFLLHVSDDELIYDLHFRLIDRFKTKGDNVHLLQLLHDSLSIVLFQLRRNNSVKYEKLRELILSISADNLSGNKSMILFNNLQLSLKNNSKNIQQKMLVKQSSFELNEELLKESLGFLKKLKIDPIHPLNLSYQQLLNADKLGRCWEIGSSIRVIIPKSENIVLNEKDEKVEKLMKMYRFNTENKRNIFLIIINSKSAEEFMEKIKQSYSSQSMLLKRDYIQIPFILILKSKKFNEIFIKILQQLLRLEKNNKMTLNCCCWDIFEKLNEEKKDENFGELEKKNFTDFLFNSFKSKLFSIEIFKKINMSNVGRELNEFLLELFLRLFKYSDWKSIENRFINSLHNNELLFYSFSFVMKLKRRRYAKNVLKHYINKSNLVEPYNVIVDVTCCCTALNHQVDLKQQIGAMLIGKKFQLFSTSCCLKEAELIGAAVRNGMQIAQQFPKFSCGHDKRGKTADNCLNSIAEVNSKEKKTNIIIVSQSVNVQNKCKLLRRIPILYLDKNIFYFIEPNPEENNEKKKDKVLGEMLEKMKESEPKKKIFKRKKLKGPNPLSCKKKKKKEISHNSNKETN